jgi:hypothetical protein
MIDRVGATGITQPAVSRPAGAGSPEVISIQLDVGREQYDTFLDALRKAGVDLGKLQVRGAGDRQKPDGGSGLRRIFDPEGMGGAPRASAAAAPAATAPGADAPEPFQPSFLNAFVTSPLGGAVPLNPHYFATQATAQWMADRYGTGEVVQMAPGGEGGPFTITERQWHFRLPDGNLVNAGVLAAHYTDGNEGLADQVIRRELIQLGRDSQSA